MSNLRCAYINTKIIITPPLNQFYPETEIKSKLAFNNVAKGTVPTCIGLLYTKVHDKKNVTIFGLLRQSFAVIRPLKLFKATFKTFIINIIIILIINFF